MRADKLGVSLAVFIFVLFSSHASMADRLYTTTQDFIDGGNAELVGLNPNIDQLKLVFPFVNIAASSRGSLVRIDADTGEIIGEYWTAPGGPFDEGAGSLPTPYPSRTSVDPRGNVWVTNSAIAGTLDRLGGSVVKIGVIIGGTAFRQEVDLDTGAISYVEDQDGEYLLLEPSVYNTCVDRDEDGFIRTSRGLGNILPWPEDTDVSGGDDGIVHDAEDECIVLYQRLPGAPEATHVSVDPTVVDGDKDVWVGGYDRINGEGGYPNSFIKLDGDTAAIIDRFTASNLEPSPGCGGFGGFVDEDGILWSSSFNQARILRYDPSLAPGERGQCIATTNRYFAWGLASDTGGFIWSSLFNPLGLFQPMVSRIDPDSSNILLSETFTDESNGTQYRGIVVTPVDNNIWVANSSANRVRRLAYNAGSLQILADILLELDGTAGINPNGMAVDANGKLWVSNKGSSSVMRIDPNAGTGGLGEVDLVVDLNSGNSIDIAGPDNYSNMAGTAKFPSGTWTVVYDSGISGAASATITWNSEPEGSEPPGTSITVAVYDDESGIYVPVSNGVPFSVDGGLIQIQATLQASSDGTSPVLSDLNIAAEEEVIGGLCFVNDDNIVDREDIILIIDARNTFALSDNDPKDADGDGIITVLDARKCVLQCTYPGCVSEPVEERQE